MTTDPGLERWRLILGAPAESHCGGLTGRAAEQGGALDWLYGRADPDLTRRGVRRGGVRGEGEGDGEGSADGGSGDGEGGNPSGRRGGTGPSVLTTVDWLDQVHRLFPKETIERLERDAVERYEILDVVTDPAVLARIEPNPTLLRAVLRTKHLMNPDVLALARRLVEAVVRELTVKLATEVRQAFSGARSRRPSRFKQARNFDFRTTIRANLGHYRPDERRVYIEEPRFTSRTRRHLDKWQLILLVDQSGSMVGSVIHAAVTAACLWSLPGLKTHLIAFDTDVVDLTSDVTDPVELLMKVQLGGGTDIARAVGYGATLIENPRRTIFVVISDFFEGGDEGRLVASVRELMQQGTQVLGLAALDEEAEPVFDHGTAQRLADVGAHVGAMTPGKLAEFVAERIGR
ncbi:VWA domain-containing protein [Spirillospora sp. NPDC048911]|uniref:VWA domain-containing protein n=1 Tax=Spirillospora sp. NPDC048911 TaxID=3364527 RepID=UPI00371F4BA9